MINDEFLIKIETIIKFLKKNGGYNYKLYNHVCPTSNNNPDSNIVEYAKDIRDYWKSLKYNEDLETYIKNEIVKIIEDNLNLFTLNDSKLIHLKKYCSSHTSKKINPTPNKLLMEFVTEALLDLINSDVLYDFRDLK